MNGRLSVFSSDGSNSCRPFASDSLHALLNAPPKFTSGNCPDFQGRDTERFALFLSVGEAFYAYGPHGRAEIAHLAEHLPKVMQLGEDFQATILPIRTDWPSGIPPMPREPVVTLPAGDNKRAQTERKLLDQAKGTLPIAKFAIFGGAPLSATLPAPEPRRAKKKQKTVLDMLRAD